MAAFAGRTNQVVGWRFTVERRLNLGPWKKVAKSVEQTTSVGGSGDAGGFSSMTVPITLPANEGMNGELVPRGGEDVLVRQGRSDRQWHLAPPR